MRRFAGGIGRRCAAVVCFVVLGLLFAGCGTFSGLVRVDPTPPPPAVTVEAPAAPTAQAEAPVETDAAPAALLEPLPDEPILAVATDDTPSGPMIAQAPPPSIQPPAEDLSDQYDPWEPFNEKMFEVNYRLDKYVLKPAANVYRKVMPEPFQVLIRNGFDNIVWLPRFVNNVLQGKFNGAGREMARFLINSTAGIGGLFDPAKDYWGIKASKEDFGQTLGVWVSGPGPYLVLPLMEPMTVRDGIGRGVDMFIDPLSYFIPFLWDRFGMKVGDTVNERALNYELFQGVEDTTLDLYSSVRHFYLKRREQQIRE